MDFKRVKAYESQLDDVMELADAEVVKSKLRAVENDFQTKQTELYTARLGIVYHETALNLSFLANTTYKGYAQKSYNVLNSLFISNTTPKGLMPFVASYRASALSLAGTETNTLKMISTAFHEFETAVKQYGTISYLPEFMRGCVALNLPWFFFSKRKFVQQDFESIITKYQHNKEYANSKIMSFTYMTWAKCHQSKDDRSIALDFLDKAIALDPDYQAGRKYAEALKIKMQS